ncbi:MAG: sigma-70 family RNA polymerase sigma factor [Cyanothece sp. SIO2G6]|nr:sigma-70 family RNA polymerase sigma factor [Cyanothece sp. SIO2G6]
MEDETDRVLVTRLWQGDLTAMGTLYDRYGRLVYGLALKGLGQVTEAEDLMQEVFLSLMRTRNYDASRGSLASYLTTVTRSRVMDRLRSQTVRRKYQHQWQRHQATADTTTPMTHLTQAENCALVRQALSSLKPEQRQVLEMSYYEGRSYSDISAQLGVPLGTVKSWARRGLLRLRQELNVLQGDLL